MSSRESRILDLGFARLDLDREDRQGLPEIVYGPGKTAEQIAEIATALLAGNTGPVPATRVEAETARTVLDLVDGSRAASARGSASGAAADTAIGRYDADARLLVWRPASVRNFSVAVAAAGTSDRPVAGRPAYVLHVLARPQDCDVLQELLFVETGTLGVRRHSVDRTVVPRRFQTVHIDGVPVRVKHGPYGAKPEHDDLAAAAGRLGLPLRVVAERVMRLSSGSTS